MHVRLQAWIADNGTQQQPFFHYTGLDIVHPPYITTQHYLDRIDTTRIVAPHWEPLQEQHPCDMQTTMKKGCALNVGYQNTTEHKVAVISVRPPPTADKFTSDHTIPVLI